ncbi:hypothetical protein V6N13_050642 [Hibiscus sabdariffa]
MARKIRNAKEMLDEIATTKSKFNLLEGRPIKNMIRGERGTYSFVKISNVIGREEDRGNVVKFLMNPTDGEDILVLPIAGIDALGNCIAALVHGRNGEFVDVTNLVPTSHVPSEACDYRLPKSAVYTRIGD